jgi:hypothetical protein
MTDEKLQDEAANLSSVFCHLSSVICLLTPIWTSSHRQMTAGWRKAN